MIDTEMKTLQTYRCPYCNAEIEAETEDWADWRVCPGCDTPSRMPEPELMFRGAPTVTAGTFYIGPEQRATPPANEPTTGRNDVDTTFSWLDNVIAPPSAIRPDPANATATPSQPDPLTARPLPVDPGTAVPLQTAGNGYGPPPEILAALKRPAQVSNANRPRAYPPLARKTSGGRAFLGMALCVGTVGLLFKLMDGEPAFAAMFAGVVLVSLLLLARPTLRR